MGQRKERPAKPILEGSVDSSNSSFVRALGSTDWHTRDAALSKLSLWLSRAPVSDLALLKLWKGVFYAFWHSDKAPVQNELAERLADVMNMVPPEVSLAYYQAFMRTMRREWLGIDHLRLDKFMMLLRKFLASLLRLLAGDAWEPSRLATYTGFWREEVLCPGDALAAAGVAYHLADTLLPELRRLAAEGGGGGARPDAAALAALLEPFCRALAAARDAAMVHRLREGLFQPLVMEVAAPGEGEPLRGLDAPALAARLFELGALPETKARSREALYALSAALEKAAQRGAGQPAAAQAGKAAQAAAATEPRPAQRQQQHEQLHQQPQQGTESTPGSSGKKKRKAAAKTAAEADATAAAGAPGTAATPGQQQQQQRRQKQQRTPATADGKGSGTAKKKAKLQPAEAAQLQAAAAAAAAEQRQRPEAQGKQPAAAPTPSSAGPPSAPDSSPGKKSVRWQLKRNVVNVIGAPPKPEHVRTPPTARPKGPALKRFSTLGGLDLYQTQSAPGRLTRGNATRIEAANGVSRLAHGSGPGDAPARAAANGLGQPRKGSQSVPAKGAHKKKKKGQQQQRGSNGAGPRRLSLKSPGKLQRPRAADFF